METGVMNEMVEVLDLIVQTRWPDAPTRAAMLACQEVFFRAAKRDGAASANVRIRYPKKKSLEGRV